MCVNGGGNCSEGGSVCTERTCRSDDGKNSLQSTPSNLMRFALESGKEDLYVLRGLSALMMGRTVYKAHHLT